MTTDSPNRAILAAVAREIQPILPELVFVGGQVADLLVTSSGTTRIRATTDVDVVVEVTTRTAFAALESRLRRLGLTPDSGEDAIICRWHTPSGQILDVLPTDPRILGFSNRWYPVAVRTAVPFELASGLVVRIPTGPVFIATKWAAFQGRGERDILGSHDLEDVITVVAGRPALVNEIRRAPRDVRGWLSTQISEFLQEEDAEYAILGALPDSVRLPDLVPNVLGRLRMLADSAPQDDDDR